MPLQSRASQARQARQETGNDEEQTQPRKPSQNVAKPAPAPRVRNTPGDEDEAQGAAQTAQSDDRPTEPTTEQGGLRDPAPARKAQKRPGRPLGSTNKPTTRTPPAVAQSDDPKALRARQREIEKEFKGLGKEHTAAVREVEQKFAARRKALEDEHAALARSLSAQVFGRA